MSDARAMGDLLIGAAALALTSEGRRLHQHAHTAFMFAQLGRVLSGDDDRLILCCPVRHGKSLSVAVMVAAWLLLKPLETVGVCCYGQDLANELSRNIRRYYAALGGAFGEEERVSRWRTARGGGMWATGIGGAVTGRGGEVLLLDDPIRGREEADSELNRRRVWEFYRGVFRTRLHPGGKIVVVQSRWHIDDLVGRLYEHEDGEDREGWRVAHLDMEHEPEALAELREQLPNNEVVTMEREPGHRLDRFPDSDIDRLKAAVGPREWWALYQGYPRPSGGTIFDVGALKVIPEAPAGDAIRVRAWDLAGSTRETADQTVGVRMAMHFTETGRFWCIEHVAFGRWGLDEREEQIAATAEADGQSVTQLVEEDMGVGGAARTAGIVAAVAPRIVKTVRPSTSKPSRADAFAGQVAVGNVSLVRGPWFIPYTDELRDFPVGTHDDFTDASAHAFNWLATQKRVLSLAEMMARGA